jgi:hypothetical protein
MAIAMLLDRRLRPRSSGSTLTPCSSAYSASSWIFRWWNGGTWCAVCLLPDLAVASFLGPLKEYLSSQEVTLPTLFSSALGLAARRARPAHRVAVKNQGCRGRPRRRLAQRAVLPHVPRSWCYEILVTSSSCPTLGARAVR